MNDPLNGTFRALAHPTRRAILALLLEDDMAVTDVAEPFRMSLAAISKHLIVLTRAGLVSQERRGRVVWCKLEPDGLRRASVWMRTFGQLDPIDLDVLERFLEAGGILEAGRGRSAALQAASGDECDDRQHDDNEADEIDDAIHGVPLPTDHS